MNILINKRYIIRLLINGKLFTFDCIITAIDNDSVSFTDINNTKFTYKLEYIVGYQEHE